MKASMRSLRFSTGISSPFGVRWVRPAALAACQSCVLRLARMADALIGCWAKIRRAEEHFQAFKAETAAASDYADRIHFVQEYDADAGTIKVTVEGVPDLPIRWSLIAADALRNLRAALNYLAWELAR